MRANHWRTSRYADRVLADLDPVVGHDRARQDLESRGGEPLSEAHQSKVGTDLWRGFLHVEERSERPPKPHPWTLVVVHLLQ